MMKSLLVSLLLASAAPGFSAEPTEAALRLAPGELQIEPSFQAASFYFRAPKNVGGPLAVEFRRVGEAPWRRAFEPVTDRPADMAKGSLFDLEEDVAWEARVVGADGAEVIPPVTFRTWSSRPPIARAIDLSRLPDAARGLVISDQGSPGGWIKYTAPPGWRLQRPHEVDDPEPAAITFRNARYVILENVTIVGGARHGVLVETSDSVRILNCEISGWGRVGVQQFTNTGTRGKYVDAKGATINYDAGVAIDRSARTVVERCYVHDPRHRANSWMFSHPAGPTAVHANSTRGGSVLRWNDFVGSDEHRWNDVIEASSNSAANGGFFRDSDISGNFLAFGNDDGVELEGGGMNVRFHRNKIEGTTCGMSTGASILGPQFVFGNLVTNPGDESGLALMFFKNSHGAEQSGKRHFINNTLYGPACSAYGAYGKPAGRDRLGFMRNNIFVASSARLPGEWGRRENFDRDLFWNERNLAAAQAYLGAWRAVGQEPNGLAADPLLVAPERGDFGLQAGSPARGRAAGVPNLVAAGADLGALGVGTEVPERPFALRAVPRQLNFPRSQQRLQSQVTLTVPATAPEAVPFEIRQNRVCDWFRVEPAAGVVPPGRTVTLTVTVEGAALRGRPLFRGAFLVRTPTGLSRPVSVYAEANFQEELRPGDAPNSVYIAAAAAAAGANVRETDAAGVAGGKYVAFTGAKSDPAVAARFSLPRAGRFALLLRASIGSDPEKRRGVQLTFDHAAAVPLAVQGPYNWSTGDTRFRVVFLHDLGELTAGEHQLRLQSVAGDVNLNEVIVTDNPAAFFIDHWQRSRTP